MKPLRATAHRARAVSARIALAALVCAISIGPVAATPAATDPFIGTWVLDRSRSKYEAGVLPERMIITMSAAEKGIHYRSEAHFASGGAATAEYTADYAGTLAMVLGSAGFMAPVSQKRIAAGVVEVSYVRGLKVVATARRVASEDGRLMTITTVSRDADRHPRTNVAVFERTTAVR